MGKRPGGACPARDQEECPSSAAGCPRQSYGSCRSCRSKPVCGGNGCCLHEAALSRACTAQPIYRDPDVGGCHDWHASNFLLEGRPKCLPKLTTSCQHDNPPSQLHHRHCVGTCR